MSDDQPTVPMPQPGSGAAQPGAAQPGAAQPGAADPSEPRRNRVPLIVMSVLAGLLLIALTVALTLLLSGALNADEPTPVPSTSLSEEPSASPEPSEEPSEEPTATTEPTTEPTQTSEPTTPPPPPPATGPTFTAFSPSNNTSVGCSGDSGQVPLTFTWSSTGATEAAIGVATNDAFAAPFETGLPPSGSYSNISYQCSNESQIYTVSIRGTSGQTNKTVTLKR